MVLETYPDVFILVYLTTSTAELAVLQGTSSWVALARTFLLAYP